LPGRSFFCSQKVSPAAGVWQTKLAAGGRHSLLQIDPNKPGRLPMPREHRKLQRLLT
jgi:hypothetical protein